MSVASVLKKRRDAFLKGLVYLALSIICLILILPFLWMVSTSLKSPDEIFLEIPRWLPEVLRVDNYTFIWTDTSYPKYLVNSLIVAMATTAIALVVASLAGYGISRFAFRGRRPFSLGLIVVQMFPAMLLVIPMFVIMRRLNLLNTYLSLIIAYGTFAFPFCTWMLKGYFDTIPEELEEAAIIEGCSRFQVLYKVVMPLAAPGLVAVALFAFVLAWQEYLFALTFTRTEEMRTLTVGIALMQGQHGGVNWGQVMAGSVLACIPGLVFFLYLERYIVQGFTLGAIKE